MKASRSNRSLSGYQKGVEDWYSPLLVRLSLRTGPVHLAGLRTSHPL